MKKILPWVVVAFLVFWLITDPRGMADSASSLGSMIADGAEQLFGSVIDFLRELG